MKHDCVSACVAGWGPTGRCHCSGCGENFSNVKNFDAHRSLKDGCSLPGERGLVQDAKGDWRKPDTGGYLDRFRT